MNLFDTGSMITVITKNVISIPNSKFQGPSIDLKAQDVIILVLRSNKVDIPHLFINSENYFQIVQNNEQWSRTFCVVRNSKLSVHVDL